MRILYGVAGEGMGHATRSAVVARHLETKGHQVLFASSGRARDYLLDRWPHRVVEVVGLSGFMADNRVEPVRAIVGNAVRQAMAWPWRHLGAHGVMAHFRPDVVLSDFEPSVAHHAAIAGKPLVAIDNIHFLTRCAHPSFTDQIGTLTSWSEAMMRPVVESCVPNADHYLVTTIAPAPVSRPKTSLHLPILREKVLDAIGQQRLGIAPMGSHVVVYFNDKASREPITTALHALGKRRPRQRFVLYGGAEDRDDGNVHHRRFDEDRFLADLASSKGVISGAGFGLMSEAIHLHKPLLAIPFGDHHEQGLNGAYLDRMGYGMTARTLSPDAIGAFLEANPAFRHNLARVDHDGNAELFASLDALLAHAERQACGPGRRWGAAS